MTCGNEPGRVSVLVFVSRDLRDAFAAAEKRVAELNQISGVTARRVNKLSSSPADLALVVGHGVVEPVVSVVLRSGSGDDDGDALLARLTTLVSVRDVQELACHMSPRYF